MAGTAQAAELIRCDRCTGHYVVDAASDGSPRVRCNKCGHVREATEPPAPASIPGKWTVIGPDGKAMSFDTWEELTESRRPSAIAPTARGLEEANHALKDLKPAAAQEKKSASALLDIAPAPKLALADMDSALDLGEPLGGQRKSRPGATTMMSGSGASSSPSGRLEPLLVKSFSQAPKTQSSAKVEWAPKIDKSVIPPRADDNTMRVEVAPAQLAASKPSEKTIVTTAKDDDIAELDSDSLLEDLSSEDDEDNGAPLSLRDAIVDEELGDDDLQDDDPDPHEKLSLKDLVVVPKTTSEAPAAAMPAPAPTPSAAPKNPSQAPPKAAVAASQAPPAKSMAPPAPRPKSLSRPDVRADEPRMSRPPPTITPDAGPKEEKAASAASRRPSVRPSVAPKPEPQSNRMWMWGAIGLVLLIGIGWRLTQTPEPQPPPPKPQPTIAPPTPVVTPATAATNDTPPATPTASASDSVVLVPPTPTVANDTPPTIATNPDKNSNPTPPANPTPTPTEKKPVAENPSTPTPAPTEKKPTVAVTDAPGSMSELLDKAGAAKRKGDLATARDLYTRVIAMSPNNVEANGGLGDVAKAQGDLGAAKTSYERALAASPTYSPALLGLADVEWDQGNQASAKKRYAQIVDRMGDRAPARAKERSQ